MAEATRKDWDSYFMEIAHLVAERSTCLRRHVGAVAVLDRHILSTGYNGTPVGVPHCDETGCLRQQLNIPSGERHEMCRAVHAEQNAIIQAGLHGVSLKGATLYCTTMPCIICMKMLINSGVVTVYYAEGYPDDMTRQIAIEGQVRVVLFPYPKNPQPMYN